jgi:hypothetical protein
VAWIRRVLRASGATAVQIAEYVGGGSRRIVAHVGSAHAEAELGLLVQQARDLLEDDRRGVLDLGLEPAVRKAAMLGPAAEPALFAHPPAVPAPGSGVGAAQVLGTASRVLSDALAAAFTGLGFDTLTDEVLQTRVG